MNSFSFIIMLYISMAVENMYIQQNVASAGNVAFAFVLFFFHFFKIQANTSHPNCRCCSIGTRQYRLHKNVVDLSAMVLLCILLLNILHIKQQQLVSQQYKFGRCLLSRKGRGAVVFLPRVATLSCRLRRVGIVHLVQ